MGALIDGLEEVREKGGAHDVVAIIWTWLECNQRKLGSLREKHTLIQAVLEGEEFHGLTGDTFTWLEENPLRNAAELLVRLNQTYGDASWPEVEYSFGVDGSEVIVCWRASLLVKSLGGADLPQASNEYPTPAALAPSLLVCPRVINDVSVDVHEPESLEWEELLLGLEKGLSSEGSAALQVHLDTLGDHGLSGEHLDEERRVGRFDPEVASAEDQSACELAAQKAVARAAGPSSLLVMPELAVTPQVLKAIKKKLRETENAPLLTVAGLYHLRPDEPPPPDDPVIGTTGWAEYVNEAVVLGPEGEELWRHRKLTCAAAEITEKAANPKDPPRKSSVAEDITLGETLRVVPTTLGIVAVVICLDTFADHARERIAKSPANVLLVPSLSKTALRHRTSLPHLVKALWGIAFVCNRWVVAGSWNDERSRSFWAIDHRPVEVPDGKDPDGHPSFVFSVIDARKKWREDD